MRAEGVELSYGQFLDCFGQRNDRILSHWLGPGTPADRIRRIGDAKEAMYRELAKRGGLVVLPGAREWLARLQRGGWLQAIPSSAPRANVEVMLAVVGLTSSVDAVVSAEDVVRGKPDPDVFLTAAARLAVPPAQCVVVEDAAAGIEAARRAGMHAIGVNQKIALDADVSVRSLEELRDDDFERLITSGADAR